MNLKTRSYGDFLGLSDHRFADERLIVFTGMSGSGKSTAIDYLLENHRDLVGVDYERVDSKPLIFDEGYESELIVVDEILEWRSLAPVWRLLWRGHRVIAANHLPEGALKTFLAPWRGRYFCTDDDPSKIAAYLDALGVAASDHAVKRFCTRYGANFTDVDIILERFPDLDFDTALGRFERFCKLELEPL